MSRPRRRRATLLAATVLTAGLALAGCSAGMVTQTADAPNQAIGSGAQTGDMLIRDLTIDPGLSQAVPAGQQSTVGLQGTLVNESALSDRLVSVSTPYALSVTLDGATTIPGDNAVRLVGSQPGAVGPVPPDNPAASTARVVLRGVTQVLRPGPTYAITFTFERAGQVTVPVIVNSTVNATTGAPAG